MTEDGVHTEGVFIYGQTLVAKGYHETIAKHTVKCKTEADFSTTYRGVCVCVCVCVSGSGRAQHVDPALRAAVMDCLNFSCAASMWSAAASCAAALWAFHVAAVSATCSIAATC